MVCELHTHPQAQNSSVLMTLPKKANEEAHNNQIDDVAVALVDGMA
jgi:hypothetical protein